MPERTPVETLRAAAEKLRTLAGKATPGPWYASDTNIGVKTSDHRMLAPFAETLLDDTDTRDNHPTASATAEWIATLHPGVAGPLADCFEQIARMVRLDADFISRVGYCEALAAARTILGEGNADRSDRAEEPTDG